MPLTDQAPFGSTGAVIKTLETYRETGLGGATITRDLVGRMGYGAEVARRVVSSLQMLELIDDDGAPTEKLREFGHAPTSQYRQLLAEHLLDVYSPVFAITGSKVDSKSSEEIEDAFRPFRPASLRKRMVALFMGLCGYVGISEAEPRLDSPRAARAGKPRVVPAKPSTPSEPPPQPEAVSSRAMTVDGARARYIDLLISKAEGAGPDADDLFDRIERVLGVDTSQKGS